MGAVAGSTRRMVVGSITILVIGVSYVATMMLVVGPDLWKEIDRQGPKLAIQAVEGGHTGDVASMFATCGQGPSSVVSSLTIHSSPYSLVPHVSGTQNVILRRKGCPTTLLVQSDVWARDMVGTTPDRKPGVGIKVTYAEEILLETHGSPSVTGRTL